MWMGVAEGPRNAECVTLGRAVVEANEEVAIFMCKKQCIKFQSCVPSDQGVFFFTQASEGRAPLRRSVRRSDNRNAWAG